jgi:hypothetical protein
LTAASTVLRFAVTACRRVPIGALECLLGEVLVPALALVLDLAELLAFLAELLAVVCVAVALGCEAGALGWEAVAPPEAAPAFPDVAPAFSFPDAALLALDVATA